MWTEAVLVALVAALGGILVEMIRARKKQDTVVNAVTPNHGTSLADGLKRIEADLREVRTEVNRHGQRLAGVEAVMGMSNNAAARRNGKAG